MLISTVIGWTGRQSSTGQHRDKRNKEPSTFIARVHLDSSINPNMHDFGLWEGMEHLEEIHAYKGK